MTTSKKDILFISLLAVTLALSLVTLALVTGLTVHLQNQLNQLQQQVDYDREQAIESIPVVTVVYYCTIRVLHIAVPCTYGSYVASWLAACSRPARVYVYDNFLYHV